MQHYRQRFLDLAALWERKVKTRSSWVEAGNTSDALIAALEARWAGTPDAPVLHEDTRSAAIGLQAGEVSKHNRMVRFMVRGYLMTETEQSLQQLQQQFSTLQAAVDRLDAQLAGTPGVDLQPLRDSVATYIRQFGQLPPIVAAQVQARQEMQEIFDSIYRNTNEIVQSQTERRSAEAGEKKALLLAITLLAIALGLVISWLIVRQLTQPLAQAVRIAERIGAGDMTEQPRQPRSDEFGQLLDALERTRGSLRDLIGRISAITGQLASAAQELSTVTEQTSAGIQSQRLETDQVATAMHEMAATVQEVARNADEASSAAQHADRRAAQGDIVVQRALAQIDRLSSQVGLSAEAMAQLNRETAGISTVLTVINGIAEQTNLLALNAAIEAARAGDAGRGFAVVADEVRSLAQRTQQSTAQIEELIGNLQKGALHASSLMDSSRGLADETVSTARDVGEELQAITRTISTIQAMNLQIATASEEQSSVAETSTAACSACAMWLTSRPPLPSRPRPRPCSWPVWAASCRPLRRASGLRAWRNRSAFSSRADWRPAFGGYSGAFSGRVSPAMRDHLPQLASGAHRCASGKTAVRAAPKEQPPRKLSGKRTATTAETLKSRPVSSPGAPKEQASRHALVNLSGPEQRGARRALGARAMTPRRSGAQQ